MSCVIAKPGTVFLSNDFEPKPFSLRRRATACSIVEILCATSNDVCSDDATAIFCRWGSPFWELCRLADKAGPRTHTAVTIAYRQTICNAVCFLSNMFFILCFSALQSYAIKQSEMLIDCLKKQSPHYMYGDFNIIILSQFLYGTSTAFSISFSICSLVTFSASAS